MVIQVTELAALVGGRVVGDEMVQCHGANPLGQASETDVTMLDDPSKVEKLEGSIAAVVVTTAELKTEIAAQIVVEDVHAAFSAIVSHFRPAMETTIPGVGVDSTAQIAPSASVHPTATIAAGAVVGERSVVMPGVVVMSGCTIGSDCVIHPGVVLYQNSELGDRVILHANTVVGAIGFGYRQQDGRHMPSAQLGYVRIESDVEVGACVTIDRGTYGATVIGEGTKIDNQVQVAHNVLIGKHNLLCAQVGIAGSSSTGDYVVMAGQVGVRDHVHIGERAVISAQTGVMSDCIDGEVYLGSPATPHREQIQIMALQRKLPAMRKELKALRRELDCLKKSSESGDVSGSISVKEQSKRAA